MILDQRHLDAPFVVVGDVHGSYFTLIEGLLPALGFAPDGVHPTGQRVVWVGDLHDRAGAFGVELGDPDLSGAVRTLRWAMDWSARGVLDVTDSNHGKKLARKLVTGERAGRDGAPFGHGLDDTLADIDAASDRSTLVPALVEFLSTRPSAARYAGGPTGEVAVAHAALKPRFLEQEELSKADKAFCIFPREFSWYGTATVVVGHVVTSGVVRERSTREDGKPTGEVIRIDTGAFDGGGLSAYLPATDSFITVPTDPRDMPDAARRHRNRFAG